MPPEAELEKERRTTFIELFFDLVLVFAITQLATLLHDVPHHHAGHLLAGWGEVGLFAAMIWWLWSQFAWPGTSADLSATRARVLSLALTGVMLIAAVMLPVALSPGPSVFGIAYAVIKLGTLALYRMDSGTDKDHIAAVRDYTRKASLAPLLVFVGAILPPELRIWVWTLGLVIEVGGTFLVGSGAFRVSASHFAERHSLVLIIVLGEAVVALGGQASTTTTAAALAGLFGGFTLVAALWWSYFSWAFEYTEKWLKGEGRPFPPGDGAAVGRMARDAFTIGHYPLVAGVIAMAVALKDLAREPLVAWNHDARVAMAVGLVLYLGGFIAVVLRGNGHVLAERLVALLCMVATTLLSPLAAGGTAVILAAELVIAIRLEMWRWRRMHPHLYGDGHKSGE